MSTSKLLQRIIRPRHVETSNGSNSKSLADATRELYFASNGISGDAMMHFAMLLASLIHDVDHCGLTNAQLSRMKTPSAIIYKNKSISEQHSMDVAWKVLMDQDFEQLRSCIYTNKFELRRFRQLLVNAVIATDIEDAQFKLNRKIRWDKAFGSSDATAAAAGSSSPLDELRRSNHRSPLDELRRSSHRSPLDELRRSSHRGDATKIDRKATLVYESIIQAADIAHTMQHWQTYAKFNERLFEEQYVAYLIGHEEQDPAQHWYESELTFFDHHVLPLAEQLRTCGVFGASSSTSTSDSGGLGGDELIGWAKQNRQEWQKHGQSLVKQMHETCVAKYHTREQQQQQQQQHVKFSRRRSNGSMSHISY
jgi:3'5'-cyclic nucleotide phosphodiesterase